MTTDKFDVHSASDQEKLDAYRNVHSIWGGGLPLDQFLETRLRSPLHNRARWFVGTVPDASGRDRVVSSMAWYPIDMISDGVPMRALGIGAVHTRTEYRGLRFAPRMLQKVISQAAAEGYQLSLLFSEISAAYYERLGFVQCGSSFRRLKLCLKESTDGPVELHEANLQQDRDTIIGIHRRFNAQFKSRIDRNEEYWECCFTRFPVASYWLATHSNSTDVFGFVRMVKGLHWQLEEYATIEPEMDVPMLMEAARLAALAGAAETYGWVPLNSRIERATEPTLMEAPIPMVARIDGKPLADELVESVHLWLGDHF